MATVVSQRAIREAEEEARADLAKLVKESRSATGALEDAKLELRYIEDELGKRSIPYGAGFVAGKGRRKRLKAQYFPGVPSKILDVRRDVFKDFIEELERQLVAPKTRREELIMYDKGHTLEELREMCRKRGLVLSGTKKELIARLV